MELICKVCGYRSRNLEPHISGEHADRGGLEWYINEYGVFPEDIVDPNLTKPEEPKAKSKKKLDPSMIDIAGKQLKKITESSQYVPSINDAYVWNEDIPDIIEDMQENLPIMLIGHTGCGKTSSIFEIGARINQGVLRVNMNGQTTIGDFVGLWTVKGGETVWIDGVLPHAMRNGLWLIVDEIDFAEPAILSVLNAVLEQHGKLTLKEKGHEIIEPHPNFRLFATGNSIGCMSDYRGLYQGTNILNEAFLDRWQVYHYDYLPAKDEVKILVKTVPKMTDRIAKQIVFIANKVRDSFKKEEISCTFSTRRLLDWGKKMIRHRDPIKGAQSTVFSKISREDAEVIRGIIIRRMRGENEDEGS